MYLIGRPVIRSLYYNARQVLRRHRKASQGCPPYRLAPLCRARVRHKYPLRTRFAAHRLRNLAYLQRRSAKPAECLTRLRWRRTDRCRGGRTVPFMKAGHAAEAAMSVRRRYMRRATVTARVTAGLAAMCAALCWRRIQRSQAAPGLHLQQSQPVSTAVAGLQPPRSGACRASAQRSAAHASSLALPGWRQQGRGRRCARGRALRHSPASRRRGPVRV